MEDEGFLAHLRQGRNLLHYGDATGLNYVGIEEIGVGIGDQFVELE